MSKVSTISAPPGCLKFGSLGGAKIYFHWSIPFGGLLVWLALGEGVLAHLPYFCMAYITLIAAHELGHFAAAKWFGVKVYDLVVTGGGGSCRFESPKISKHAYWIISGGFLAQIALLLATIAYVLRFGLPSASMGIALVNTLLYANVFLLLTNLLPLKLSNNFETDGFMLWLLLKHSYFGGENPFPQISDVSPVLPKETSLLEAGFAFPVGAKFGIEVLNDNTTPMVFVMEIFTDYFGMSDREAYTKMLKIHHDGGLIVACASREEAELLESEIIDECKLRGHQFVCRAVARPSAN